LEADRQGMGKGNILQEEVPQFEIHNHKEMKASWTWKLEKNDLFLDHHDVHYHDHLDIRQIHSIVREIHCSL
jgi:hypothetical protein